MMYSNFENYLHTTCFLLVLSSMVFYFLEFIVFTTQTFHFLGTIGIICSNLCIGIILILRWTQTGHFPLTNLYESLLFLTWSLTVFHLYIENISKKPILAVITSPIILLTNSFSNFNLPEDLKVAGPLIPALQSNWLLMHVSIMILSYGALLIGCLLSIAIIILDPIVQMNGVEKKYFPKTTVPFSSLKINSFFEVTDTAVNTSKNFENLITIIDNLSYRTIGIGFIFLTIGIVSGAVWANEAWGSYWSWDPKETWAFITWLVFATYLHTRIIKGWQGVKPAIISTIGFFVIWICFLGVNLLAKGLHSYGWFSS